MNDERLKTVLGFTVIMSYVGLAAAVALGKVEEGTSFGLPFILGALAPVMNNIGKHIWYDFSSKGET